MYDNNNIFAKIIRKEAPAKIVFENDKVLAFHTIEPKADVHVLIVPKGEYVAFQDFVRNAPSEVISSFFCTIDEIAVLLNIAKSYRLVTNHGKQMNQEVPHFHMHLMHNYS